MGNNTNQSLIILSVLVSSIVLCEPNELTNVYVYLQECQRNTIIIFIEIYYATFICISEQYYVSASARVELKTINHHRKSQFCSN